VYKVLIQGLQHKTAWCTAFCCKGYNTPVQGVQGVAACKVICSRLHQEELKYDTENTNFIITCPFLGRFG
jgi:hypothetical protein